MRRGFWRALLNSKASYTCGSGLEYPVRKFFEIPASGALLSSRYFPGLTALGFRDGENWMCAEPGDLPDITLELLSDDLSRAQAIASRGRELILEQHSLEARAQQFRSMIELIMQGRFDGSEWNQGRLILHGH